MSLNKTYGYYEILNMKDGAYISNVRYDIWILSTDEGRDKQYQACKNKPCQWYGNNDGYNMFTGFVRLVKYSLDGQINHIYEGEMIEGYPYGFGRLIKPGYNEMFVGRFYDGFDFADAGAGVYIDD